MKLTNVYLSDFQGRLTVTMALIVMALLASPRDWESGARAAVNESPPCGSTGTGWRIAGQYLSDYAVGEVVTADFNRDGKADFAIAEPNLLNSVPGISIALGDGHGYFEMFTRIEILGSPRNLQVSDFNGDAKPDIFFSGYRSTTADAISVLVGNGDGTFVLRNVANLTAPVAGFALADFNGDGRQDIAIMSEQSGNSIALALGNSIGRFDLQRQPISLSAAPVNLATADFNKDGKADIVVTLSPGFKQAVLIGGGNGTFTEIAGPTARNSVRRIQAGDFNGDNNPDLIAAEVGAVEVFSGDGQGGFSQPKSFNTGSAPSVVTGDFSGDGKIDMAALNGAVSMFLNDGASGFTAGDIFAAGKAPSSLVAGDFNGDGKLDLAAPDPQQQSVSILLNSGESHFVAPTIFGSGSFISSIVTGDLNKDGRPDLISSGSSFSGVSVALGSGKGGFGMPIIYSQSFNSNDSVIALAIADFNQDGNADLAVTVRESLNFTGAIVLLAGDGNGVFSATRSRRFALGALPYDLVAADFNGDGRPDLATVNALANEVSLLLNDGRGGFAASQSIGVGLEPRSLAVADFNGDGKSDLVTANRNSATLTILLGDGKGGFTSMLIGVGANPRLVKTADVNGDGKSDLIVPHNNSEFISVLLGNGDGGFTEPLASSVGAVPQNLAIGDINGDGRLDFVMTATAGGQSLDNARIFHGDGTGKFTAAGQLLAPQATVVNTLDSNGDGLVDLLVTASVANFGAGIFVILGQCNAVPNGLTCASAASFRRSQLAAESIVTAFGPSLSAETVSAASLPLPTQLAGASVQVKDSTGIERLAPLFFVSPNQLNYLMPKGTATGTAVVTVINGNGLVSGTSQIAAVAPGLFAANASGRGAASAIILRVKPDGRQIYQPIVKFDSLQNQYVFVPIDLGVVPENVLDTVFLIIFGTGIRGRSSLNGVEVMIGNQFLDALYAGAVDDFAGLDQINVRLTNSGVQRGESDVRIIVDGKMANPVRISIL